MEDSYTVHRRRKAAARRREKTPEPRVNTSTSPGLEENDVDNNKIDSLENETMSTEETLAPAAILTPAAEMDEEVERRARMEKMVEDTERMEMMAEGEQQRVKPISGQYETEKDPKQTRSRSPAVNRLEAERKTGAQAAVSPARKSNASEETPVKVSKRSRDSNTGTELRRRICSPEASSNRCSRHLSPSMSLSDEERSELHRTSSKKRGRSGQRYQHLSDEEELPEVPPINRSRRSPSQPLKKQIIPLSDHSLIEDVARAKRAYAHREPNDDYEYEDEEEVEEDEGELDEYIRPRRKRNITVRKRKNSIIHTDHEKEQIRKHVNQVSSWWSWIPFFGRRKKVEEMIKEAEKEKKKGREKVHDDESLTPQRNLEKLSTTVTEPEKNTTRDFFRSIGEINAEFNEFCRQNPQEVQIICELRNLCIVETILTIVVCGLGAFAFRFTEGAFEQFYKCGVKRVKRDFLDSLWNYSHNLKEDDWKSMARRKLMEFEEQLHAAHEAGVQTYSGQKSWTFLNSMVYCLTVITTIGYGHISPSTTTGRALTIVYAIFGIPMFLIVLADFGKLFTRGIKFLWAFVRRLYYTGSCRKVRRNVQMQEMMKGVQLVYDLATFRRPSQMTPEELQEMQRQQQTVLSLDGNAPQQQPESPSTPAMSTFEIDDEFNLPISVAITILVVYIFIGATIFNIFEDWTFFESFYFVFISMSTIGFGDFVPMEPLYMMLSIVYLIFGLALTSMCINVVQVMLADQFKHASHKIGATIGFHVSEEDGSLKPAPAEVVEVVEVAETDGAAEAAKEKVPPKPKEEEAVL